MVVLFSVASVSICVCSVLGDWDGGIFHNVEEFNESPPDSVNESYFENSSFYLWKNDQPVLKLNTSELVTNAFSDRIDFLNPSGLVHSPEGGVLYEGHKGIFNKRARALSLFGDVKVETAYSTFESQKIEYLFAQDRLSAEGGVQTRSLFPQTLDRVVVSSESLLSFLKMKETTYYGGAKGSIKKKRVYEEGIDFSSEEITLNLVSGKVDLNREVTVQKQSLWASSSRGEIFLENFNKKLRYLALYDDVKLVEKVSPASNGELLERRAFSEKLEFIASEGKIFLTGSPRVVQRNDIIRGNTITIRENNETVEVEDANTNFQLR